MLEFAASRTQPSQPASSSDIAPDLNSGVPLAKNKLFSSTMAPASSTAQVDSSASRPASFFALVKMTE